MKNFEKDTNENEFSFLGERMQDFYDHLNQEMMEQEHIIKTNTTLEKPNLYKVVLVDDDFTTQDFVITILKKIFHKTNNDATEIMLQTHSDGRGICGVYTRDVAETKVMQVIDSARDGNFPLKCILNKS